MAYAARGSRSRGWPTEPGLAISLGSRLIGSPTFIGFRLTRSVFSSSWNIHCRWECPTKHQGVVKWSKFSRADNVFRIYSQTESRGLPWTRVASPRTFTFEGRERRKSMLSAVGAGFGYFNHPRGSP